MTDDTLTPHARANRVIWDDARSNGFRERAAAQWAAAPHWGIFATPESELHVLSDVAGRDVIDLGCGTAYVDAWVVRAGGRPVGIDNSAVQLATARALQEAHGLDFPLIHGSAEQVPLPDASFDVALSEHGASSWCDPYLWIPEAARLLRPGGQLIFLRTSTLVELCSDQSGDGRTGTELITSYADVERVDRADGGTHFQLPTGLLVRLLRRSGLVLDDLVEIVAPPGTPSDFDHVSADWASKWPSTELWKATKVAVG